MLRIDLMNVGFTETTWHVRAVRRDHSHTTFKLHYGQKVWYCYKFKEDPRENCHVSVGKVIGWERECDPTLSDWVFLFETDKLGKKVRANSISFPFPNIGACNWFNGNKNQISALLKQVFTFEIELPCVYKQMSKCFCMFGWNRRLL